MRPAGVRDDGVAPPATFREDEVPDPREPGDDRIGVIEAEPDAALQDRELDAQRDRGERQRIVADHPPLMIQEIARASVAKRLPHRPGPEHGEGREAEAGDRAAVRPEGDQQTANRAGEHRGDVDSPGVPMQRRIPRPDPGAELEGAHDEREAGRENVETRERRVRLEAKLERGIDRGDEKESERVQPERQRRHGHHGPQGHANRRDHRRVTFGGT
jgi:hypothetical protein